PGDRDGAVEQPALDDHGPLLGQSVALLGCLMHRKFKLHKRSPRRTFLKSAAAAASAVALAGCDNLSRTTWFPKVLDSVEPLNHALAKLVGRKAMAQEFAESDRSPTFRSNGSDDPDTPQYNAWVE